MKLIMENWRSYMGEQDDPPAEAGKLSKISSFISQKWNKMDDKLKDDHCTKKFPELMQAQGDIKTFGDLHALLKCTLDYKDKKKVLSVLASLVPGIAAAKEVFNQSKEVADFVLGMYQVPDGERPEGNLGKLDMDDGVSKIISNEVEKAFVKWLIKSIADNKNLETEIPNDWNVTNELRNYLKGRDDEYKGSTITGYAGED